MTAGVPQLDAATVKAGVDPRNLLEEVHAQLRTSGAWMSENGIAQRCRLAKSRKEVIGALIELKRQGCAEEGGELGGRPLWRTIPSGALEISPRDVHTAELPPAAAFPPVISIEIPPAAPEAVSRVRELLNHVRDVRTANPHPEAVTAASTTEVPMTRIDRMTPITEALRSGALSAERLSAITKLPMKAVSQTLSRMKGLGLITIDKSTTPMVWALKASEAAKKSGMPAPFHGRSPLEPIGPVTPRWLLGSDGSVRVEQAGPVPGQHVSIELSAEEFATLKRAHGVISAAKVFADRADPTEA